MNGRLEIRPSSWIRQHQGSTRAAVAALMLASDRPPAEQEERHPPIVTATWENAPKDGEDFELPHGETIHIDNGVVFYKLEPGDTIDSLSRAFAQYKDDARFVYFQNPKAQLWKSTFIDGKLPELSGDHPTYIPLPREQEKRRISEAEFKNAVQEAIAEMKDPSFPYHQKFIEILQNIPVDKFIDTLEAIAKKESGTPMGQFDIPLYQPNHKTFSYSIYHVMDVDAGHEARKKLDLSLGDTFDIKNACKLFVGYLIEKLKENKDLELESLFPLSDETKAETFAAFYNGGTKNGNHWTPNNPDYAKELRELYDGTLGTR